MLEEMERLIRLAKEHIDLARTRRGKVAPDQAARNLQEAVVLAARALLEAGGRRSDVQGSTLLAEFRSLIQMTGGLDVQLASTVDGLSKVPKPDTATIDRVFDDAEDFAGSIDRFLVDRQLKFTQGISEPGFDFTAPDRIRPPFDLNEVRDLVGVRRAWGVAPEGFVR